MHAELCCVALPFAASLGVIVHATYMYFHIHYLLCVGVLGSVLCVEANGMSSLSLTTYPYIPYIES